MQLLLLPLPLPQIAHKTFIDENAVQPGQVNTLYGWADVAHADKHADRLQEVISTNSSDAHIDYLESSLQQAGLTPFTQKYRYRSSGLTASGTNVYAVLHSLKAGPAEAVVICATFDSREHGYSNIRGIATLLALARHLQRIPAWSKDIILLLADGDLDGVQAWLAGYYGYAQSGLVSDQIRGTSSSIWGALVLDYPFHSFDEVAIYFDGVNGRLPNMDLVNSAAHVAKWVGGVRVILHNVTFVQPDESTSITDRYVQRARGLLQQLDYGVSTRPSGPEGLFGQYGIDAVGLFAVPADGPHGFYAIGRIAEAQLRAMNNLLERLHASFFLYLLPEPFQFLSVASYLSAPISIGAALTISGLRTWRLAPIGTAVQSLSWLLGSSAVYALVGISINFKLSMLLAGAMSAIMSGLATTFCARSQHTLLAFLLLAVGMVSAVATILNYGLGVAIVTAVGVPLLLVLYLPTRFVQYVTIALIGGLAAVSSQRLETMARAVRISGAPALILYSALFAPLWGQTLLVAWAR